MTFYKTTASLVTLLALLAPSVQADEMTAEDILQRLQAQRSRTLGFVEASKPAGETGEETAVTMAPVAPVDESAGSTAPSVSSTGLTLQASSSDNGSSGLQLNATQDATSTQSAPSVTATQGNETMPTLATAPATPPEQPAMPMTIDLTIYFDFDSALLQPKSKTQLTALCAAIKSDTGEGTYQIIGHTDAKGKASYNQRLSQARADEVVRYMTSSCGIDGARLKAVGAGEGHLKLPKDPQSPENRRVEVQVLS
ncbi:OmpA family protein [Roseobacter sp. N2S]|uniref:OmpA family protein n=1 Tax=Roseobacter sp. N2S TaxID=2663844 RepID=UPI0028635800|nr:OmpA family protein [Roseobacter sp. N2S]MDR6265584.1 outer membrane protein OmpA-like peptidoglycan-associated protein [Roseobacter sp. N2S]